MQNATALRSVATYLQIERILVDGESIANQPPLSAKSAYNGRLFRQASMEIRGASLRSRLRRPQSMVHGRR